MNMYMMLECSRRPYCERTYMYFRLMEVSKLWWSHS